ncbi:hypothetical protein FLACOL_01942 [Flavobacterium columnare]|uniref:Uncharacterized protein n=1 Tax=Flavobacterium columnare TaxID=996 RepID=A0A2N9PC43_9FLAO|nr:hypothetical protein FLACOL_01942 [Flavobacterium columnare]
MLIIQGGGISDDDHDGPKILRPTGIKTLSQQ